MKKTKQFLSVSLLVLSGLLAGCATHPQVSAPPVVPLKPDHLTIANGATNYIVTITYKDPGTDQGLPLGTGPKDLLKLGTSLLSLNSDLPAFLSKSNLVSLSGLVDLVDKLRALPSPEIFQTNLNSQIRELLNNQLSLVAAGQSANLHITVSLEAITAAYLKAYLNGDFVDRWGTKLSQPDLTKANTDTTEAFTKVLLEAMFDYSMMTPIVHDATQSDDETPTFAVLFPALYERVSENSDRRGITAAELEAINYVSTLSDEQGKHLSSLLVRTIGGGAVGLKVSIGDNDTLAKIVSTLCEESARRVAENQAYSMLEEFKYTTNNPSGFTADEAGNSTNVPYLSPDLQKGMAAFLGSQEDLKALLNKKGGSK